MTYQNDFTLPEPLLEQLSAYGVDALPDLFRALLNAAMQIERQNHLGAAPHERTEGRTGHANGYKDKTLATRLGRDHGRRPPGARGWVLSAKPGTRHPLGSGLEAGPGRDVRAGRLHPQGRRHHRAALRLLGQQRPGPARRPRNSMPPWTPGAAARWPNALTCCWTPATRKCVRQALSRTPPF